MIKLTNVIKRINSQVIIENLNLELPDAGLIVLEGRLGSGKSTLLKLIAGLDKPSAGTIQIDGQTITSKPYGVISRHLEENISFIFSKDKLIDNLTVEENIRLVCPDEPYEEIVSTLRIEPLLDVVAGSLSPIEKSLVGVARGLLKKSKILLVDEPIVMADTTYRNIILEMLKKRALDRLVILATSDKEIKDIAGDMVVTLVTGRLESAIIKKEFVNTTIVSCHKNKFASLKFANKVLFSNKKKIAKTSIFFLLALLCFLLASSLNSLDYTEMEADTMVKEQDTSFYLRKVTKEMNFYKFVNFKDEDIDLLKNELNNSLAFGKRINIENAFIAFDIDYKKDADIPSYYNVALRDFTFYSLSTCDELLNGSLPRRKDEVAISSYLADAIINFGIKDVDGNYYRPTSYDEIINARHAIDLAGISIYISGIYKLDMEKFETLKEEKNDYLYSRMNNYLSHIASGVYVTDSFFEMYRNYKPTLAKNNVVVLNPGYEDIMGYQPGKDLNFKVLNKPVLLKRTETYVEHLADDEIIINGSLLNDIKKNPETVQGTEIKLYIENILDRSTTELKTFRIVGISEDGNNYMSRRALDGYLIEPLVSEQAHFREDNRDTIEKIIKSYTEERGYYITSDFSYIYDTLESDIPYYSMMIFFTGIILAIVAFLFMLNYIFYSIRDHRNDIAILKSLGISNDKILSTFAIEIVTLIVKGYIFALITYFLVRIIIDVTATHILTLSIDLIPIRPFYIVWLLVATLCAASLISLVYYIKVRMSKCV